MTINTYHFDNPPFHWDNPFGSDGIFIVGEGGGFSTIYDAAAAVSALPSMTDEITTAFTITESTTGGTLDKRLITGDTANSLDSFVVGQVVGVEIDGSGCPILGIIYSAGADPAILLKNPLSADITSVSCVVGIPSYKAIHVMPGHVETIVSGGAIAVPSFTTVEAEVRGTTRIEAISGAAVFTIAATSNETRFKGIGISSKTKGGVRLFEYASHNYQADTYIQDIDGFSAGQDAIFFADGVLGGVNMTGCNLTSGYDIFRLRQHREVNAYNNVLEAFSLSATPGDGYAQASVFAIGTGAAPTTVPVENYNIVGNILKTFGQDHLSGILKHGSVRVIDIRNRISSAANVNISGNSFYATGDVDTSGTGEVVGVKCIGSSSGETPNIICSANIFDIRNNGTGDAFAMDSDQANYNILSSMDNSVVSAESGTPANVTDNSANLV